MKIHMVKKGDSLYSIAQKYNVSLEELIQANPEITNPDVIDVGMKVKIPMPATPAYEVMHQHKVQQGDSLWKLSKAWGIPLETLIKANPQLKNPNALLTGEMVNIPKVAVGGVQTPSAGNNAVLPGGKKNTGVMPGAEVAPAEQAPVNVEPAPTPAPAPAPAPEIHLPPIQIHYEHIDLFKQYPVPAVEAVSPVQEYPKDYGHEHHGYGHYGYGQGGVGYGHPYGYGYGVGPAGVGPTGVGPDAVSGMPGSNVPNFPTQELAQSYASPFGGGWVGETAGEEVVPVPAPAPVQTLPETPAPAPVPAPAPMPMPMPNMAPTTLPAPAPMPSYGHGHGYGVPGTPVSPSFVSPAAAWPHPGCNTCTGSPVWPGSTSVSPFAAGPAAQPHGYGMGHGGYGYPEMPTGMAPSMSTMPNMPTMPTMMTPSGITMPSSMPGYEAGAYGGYPTAVSPLGTTPGYGPVPFAPFGLGLPGFGPIGHMHGPVNPLQHSEDCRDGSLAEGGAQAESKAAVRASEAPKKSGSQPKAKIKSSAPRRSSKPKQKKSMPWMKW